MTYPKRPILSASETEYMLSIHPNDRLRVRAIGGWIWDPGKKVWRFPKEKRYYSAIIAEFGEDLVVEASVSVPAVQPVVVPAAQPAQPPEASIEDLIEVKAEVKSLERDLARAREETDAARATAKRFEEALQSNVGEDKIERLVKEIALEAADQEKGLAELLSHVELDNMPIALARRVHEELRSILRVFDKDVTFRSLLDEARDADCLPREAIDLAHTVRKTRNFVAHEEQSRTQRRARSLLSLMACALMWNDLVAARNI